MRVVYTVLFYGLLPFILLRLLWRARRAPAYAARWGERFGYFDSRSSTRPAIWIHAVSVGETLAALPLITLLLQRFPQYELIVTTTTPTGSERVRAALGDSVFHVYGPYDLPDSIGRFLNRVRPDLAIIMETELWPNMIHACARRQIPLLLANARLSQKSAQGYARLGALTRGMLQSISLIAAQTQDDGDRFVALGADPQAVKTTGNIKFDLTLTAEQQELAQVFRRRWNNGNSRQVLLAASTHDGEDALLLEGLASLLRYCPESLLVLVPRHPERFQTVARLAATQFKVQLHSQGEPIDADTQVIVGDSMGELQTLLGASDVVFMGGTWVNNGGHNLIEPAAWGKPIVAGPSLFNFAEVSRLLLEGGAMTLVDSPRELASEVSRLFADPSAMAQMGAEGRRIAQANRGALERLLTHITERMPH